MDVWMFGCCDDEVLDRGKLSRLPKQNLYNHDHITLDASGIKASSRSYHLEAVGVPSLLQKTVDATSSATT
jgi:hypothetical protein